ncbi:MAG: transposase [Pirellulales bacterium]
MTEPKPIYRRDNLNSPAFHLRYGWTGWPSSGLFPEPLPESAMGELSQDWEADGLRRLEGKWSQKKIQITFSASPQVSPVFLAARAKGRLQHALRKAGRPTKFSRKVAVRSIGDNTTAQVEAYIQRQVDKEPLADPRFREFLRQFTIEDAAVDLAQPTETLSGRYWYNLHVVLVVRERGWITDEATLTLLRDRSIGIARKKSYLVRALSVMPDHVHLALRGHVEHSPEEIALAFMNNLAFAVGQNAIWEYGYYAGTFGEYDMRAVRL